MIKSKKGQMKIQQMAFMLIAVTLFFVFAGLFVVTILFSDVKDSAKLLDEKNALLLVSKLADSAEFSCGTSLGGSRVNCVDEDKVMALKQNIDKYSDFWKVSGIEVVSINSNNGEECNLENYPDCGKITLLDANGGTGVSNFVALCRKQYTNGLPDEKCELARLIVTYGA